MAEMDSIYIKEEEFGYGAGSKANGNLASIL